jgi:glycosyltransferase involved in cell wall biosynthesis
MKRVLHVLGELRPSGAEVMMRLSAQHWRELGLQCEILSTGSIPGSFTSVLKEAGYTVLHLPFAKSYRFLKDFYTTVKRGRYDTIHLHTERANFAYAVLARCAGVKQVVSTIHATFQFRGWLRIERSLQRFVMRQIGVRFGMISPSVASVEREHFRNFGPRIVNWFDDSQFTPPTIEQRNTARQQLGLRPEEFVIVSMGNCERVKNHATLIEALPLLERGITYKYLHVGFSGETEVEERLVSQLGIRNAVHFLGHVDAPVRCLWAADVFVMPSLREGFSIAAIEAIATGCPVILGDVPGLCDLKSLGDGLYYTGLSPKQIAAAIMSVYRLSPAERYWGAAALSTAVHRQFCIEAGVHSVALNLYQLPERSGAPMGAREAAVSH